MVTDNTSTTLPDYARLPINRCNLPAVILGSLTFQRHPAPLLLDGVHELHKDLLARLAAVSDSTLRAWQLMNYMAVHFRLDALDEVGYAQGSRIDRGKAD